MFAIGDEEWPGLSKVAEECGELLQIIGKLMGTRGEAVHWDGRDLRQELLDEMADVQASIAFTLDTNNFTLEQRQEFGRRSLGKLHLFHSWHKKEDPPPSKAGAGMHDAQCERPMSGTSCRCNLRRREAETPKLCGHGYQVPHVYKDRGQPQRQCPGPLDPEAAREMLE